MGAEGCCSSVILSTAAMRVKGASYRNLSISGICPILLW